MLRPTLMFCLHRPVVLTSSLLSVAAGPSPFQHHDHHHYSALRPLSQLYTIRIFRTSLPHLQPAMTASATTFDKPKSLCLPGCTRELGSAMKTTPASSPGASTPRGGPESTSTRIRGMPVMIGDRCANRACVCLKKPGGGGSESRRAVQCSAIKPRMDDWSPIPSCSFPGLTTTSCSQSGSPKQRHVVRAVL